jgi:ferrous iron transport protein A
MTLSDAAGSVPQEHPSSIPSGQPASLASCPKGWRGWVAGFAETLPTGGGLDPRELERRLLEMSFIEGAEIEVLHEGPLGRDPIAVRIAGAGVIALRRRDAALIQVVAIRPG